MTLYNASKNIESVRLVDEFLEKWNSPDSFMEVVSSGSTGPPKSIKLSKTHMKASARATCQYLGLKKGDRALLCLSVEYIAGMMMLVRALEFDLDLIIIDPSTTPLSDLAGEFDFCAMVPMQVKGTLNHHPTDIKRVKTLLIGGAPLSPALEKKIVSHANKVYHSFGMTETISHVALRALHNLQTKFEALPGITFSATNQRLCIHAPELGIESLITNDLVDLVDQTHFTWLGRSDYVINSGGIKIHPEQIEATLSQFIKHPFFSAGIPHDVFGEEHIICVESDPYPIQHEWFKDFKKHLKPRKFYFFKQFDYTGSGKIDKLKTLKRLADASMQIL